jgi:hypothetical protein
VLRGAPHHASGDLPSGALALVTGVALAPVVVVWDSVARLASRTAPTSSISPTTNPTLTSRACRLHDNCRWKTQNVTVENNTMVGTACTVANLCGFNGLFSNYGTSRYNQTGPITYRQDSQFPNNTLLERVRPGRRQHPGLTKTHNWGLARDSVLYQGRSVALQSPTGRVAARMTSRRS